ncbi:MAG: tetratricopeptide repeat protein [Desulfosalsimonadaceae bacterium]
MDIWRDMIGSLPRFCAFTLFALLFAIAGCAAMQQEGRKIEINEEDDLLPAFSVPKSSGGSYYYYLMAQRLIRDQDLEGAARFMEQAISRDPDAVLPKQELALIYLQTGKKDKALGLCEQILDMQPDNIETLIIAGSIRQSMEDIETARDLYESVIEKAPDRKNIYLVLGRLYLQDGLHEEAIHVFQRLVKQDPEAYVGYYYLGMAYAGAGEKDRAIEALRRAVEIEPGFLEARFELVNIYDDRDESDKVIDIYEDIVEEDPENISAAIALGLLYLKNDYEWKADALFEKLGLMAEIDRTVIDTVIQDLIAQDRYEEAISVVEGMLKGLPEDQDLHYLAGISEYLIGNYDEALSHLNQVGLDSRFYVDAVIQKADIYNQKQQQNKGINVLESAFENADRFSKPHRVRLIRFLGAFYVDAGEYQSAIGILRRGLALEPDNTDFHYDLGVAYDKSGEPQKTIEQMKMVIETDPEHADALNYLGYTYALAGDNLDEAEELVRRALEIKPDSGYILDSMGWVYFQKGDIEKAVSYLEKAVEKRPEDPEILTHLGDAYLKQQREAEALALYERALLSLDAADGADLSDDRREIEKKIESVKNR